MAGGELWGVWAQTITNDTTAANVEKYGEIEDMAEAYRDGFAKDFCDGQTSPTPPRWPDDGMQLLYFYDRESAELVSQFLRGDIDDRIAGGMLAPTVTPSWSTAVEAVLQGVDRFIPAESMAEADRRIGDLMLEGRSASLEHLSLEAKNELLRGCETSLTPYGIKLERLDELSGVQHLAEARGARLTIGDDSFLVGRIRVNPELLNRYTDPTEVAIRQLRWEFNRDYTINNLSNQLETRPWAREEIEQSIALLRETPVFTVDAYGPPEDFIANSIAHEAGHCIAGAYEIESGMFSEFNREVQGLTASTLSEYSRESTAELFCEIHACVTMGLADNVRPDLLKAYNLAMRKAGF